MLYKDVSIKNTYNNVRLLKSRKSLQFVSLNSRHFDHFLGSHSNVDNFPSLPLSSCLKSGRSLLNSLPIGYCEGFICFIVQPEQQSGLLAVLWLLGGVKAHLFKHRFIMFEACVHLNPEISDELKIRDLRMILDSDKSRNSVLGHTGLPQILP